MYLMGPTIHNNKPKNKFYQFTAHACSITTSIGAPCNDIDAEDTAAVKNVTIDKP